MRAHTQAVALASYQAKERLISKHIEKGYIIACIKLHEVILK
jgi:hypothetical protein